MKLMLYMAILLSVFIYNVTNFIQLICHMQVHLSGKLHPRSDVTSKKYKPTFLTTHLMTVLQPSGYSISHDGDTPIQLSLP